MEQTGEQEEMAQKGLALGIDFGNSKLSAAVWDPNKKSPSIVLIDEKYQLPATLYCTNISEQKDGGEGGESNPNFEVKAEIGVDLTEEKNIDFFVYDIKKLIGQTNDNGNLENVIPHLNYKLVCENDNILCFNEKVPFEKLAKLFIEKIKTCAEKQFGDEVNSCTISVPHGFNYNQRSSIKEAAQRAGINNVYIINDPLSTAIYYASRNKIQKTENFLIIDFGSSKLDISLLTINKKNSIKIKLTGGDSNLGSDIFNREIEKDIKETYKSEGGIIPEDSDKKKLIIIEQMAEKIKKELTFNLETSINLKKFDGKTDLIYSIKREGFDDINSSHYMHILKLIKNVIKESKIQPNEINHVILQGDAIRIVTLTNYIKKEFPDSDIIEDLYDSIAYGSAIYTAKKIGTMNNEQFKNFKIYDITPLSLGIRSEGDLMSVILPKGSRVPIKVMKYYITTQDSQSNIKFEIYTGERKLTKDNDLLNKIMLKNLPQMNKGQVKIEVIFEVDENFRLHVSVKELTSQNTNNCNVEINKNYSQTQILEKIEDAKKHEQEDMDEKQRIQAMLRLNDKIFEYIHLYEGNEDILRELESYRNWIKHSSTVQKEEYEKKLKELNDTMIRDKNDPKNRKQPGNIPKKTNNKIEEEKNPESK